MAQVNWDLFKCRASAINKMMATKPGEKPISDIGLRKIGEFEEKMKSKPLAPGMALEYAALIQKRDNPPKQELADGCIGYLLEVYAWLRFGIIPVGKESLDMLQMRKGKECEQIALKLLSSVDGEVYKQHKERIEVEILQEYGSTMKHYVSDKGFYHPYQLRCYQKEIPAEKIPAIKAAIEKAINQ